MPSAPAAGPTPDALDALPEVALPRGSGGLWGGRRVKSSSFPKRHLLSKAAISNCSPPLAVTFPWPPGNPSSIDLRTS